MQLIKTTQQLQQTGIKLELPFTLFIPHSPDPIIIQKSLRLLPAKRLTALADWNNKRVVVKLFFAKKRWQTHGQREAQGLRALQSANISTPKMLYAGATSIANCFIIITDYVANARTLGQVLQSLPLKQQVHYLKKAVVLTAHLHNQQLLQNDLHLDNFLITQDEDFLVIDGDKILHHSKKISRLTGKNNLALLFAQCVPYHEYWALQLTSYYLEKRNASTHDDISALVAVKVQQRQNNYLKKTLRNCTAFFSEKNWHQFAVWCRGSINLSADQLVFQLESALDLPKALLKKGRTATVAKVDIAEKECVIKRYNIKSFWHAMSRCWRPSRAWKTWRNAHCLEFWNISTPKPLALVEKRWGWFRQEAYYLSDYVEGVPLDRYFSSQPELNVQAMKIISQVCDLFEALLEAKLSHGDLKASNILLVNDKLLLLDLDSMRQHRFNFSLKRAWIRDLKRFLRNWDDLPAVRQVFEASIVGAPTRGAPTID